MVKINYLPISGREAINKAGAPYEVVVEFYKAFNTKDLALMAENWLQTFDTIMALPIGEIKKGWPEIQNFYEKSFKNLADIHLELRDYTLFEELGCCLVIGTERMSLRLATGYVHFDARVTRLFVMDGGRYCQLHQHASIDTPATLSSYSELIKSCDLI